MPGSGMLLVMPAALRMAAGRLASTDECEQGIDAEPQPAPWSEGRPARSSRMT